jgi:hypothetical protein
MAAPRKNLQKKSTKQRDAALARRRDAWELRMQGWSYRAIAAHIGRTHKTVFEQLEATRAELRQETREYASEERSRELQDLEALRSQLLTESRLRKRKEPLSKTVLAFVKVSDRRSKLLGLDAPTTSKTELTGPGGGPLVTASEGWEARLIALGWTPPKGKGKEILPGLPSPGEGNVIDAVASTTVIEVTE